jgi:hypothetical protein
MKKLFTSALSMLGLSKADDSGQKIQTIDASRILYSVPTLSDDLAPMEQLDGTLPKDTFAFHEDDWCQVEFLPKDRIAELQRILKEYKAFEAANRTKQGWRSVYVRKIQRSPLITGADALRRLETLLGAKAGQSPILYSSGAITGHVVNGFSIPLGGNITLYGYTTEDGIPVLAASVGAHPDDRLLVNTFVKLNTEAGLVLVDWKQQMALVGSTPSGEIEALRP